MQSRTDYRMGPERELSTVCDLNDRPQTGRMAHWFWPHVHELNWPANCLFIILGGSEKGMTYSLLSILCLCLLCYPFYCILFAQVVQSFHLLETTLKNFALMTLSCNCVYHKVIQPPHLPTHTHRHTQDLESMVVFFSCHSTWPLGAIHWSLSTQQAVRNPCSQKWSTLHVLIPTALRPYSLSLTPDWCPLKLNCCAMQLWNLRW